MLSQHASPAISFLANQLAIQALQFKSPPQIADDLGKQADLFFKQGEIETALLYYRKARGLRPDIAEHFHGLGAASLIYGDFETAIDCYRHLVRIHHSNPTTWCNLGHAYLFSGRFDLGCRCFYRALALQPGHTDAHLGLALFHLTLGHFKQGWRHYELRPKATPIAPPWKGEPLEGRRILLHAEQGLGDTLQFVRYVSMVNARGGQILLQIQPALRRLLSGMEGVKEFVSPGDHPSNVWRQCALPSLPGILASTSTGPIRVPYLSVPARETAVWAERLAGPGLKVGLAWAGDPKNMRDRHRSISLQQLEPLLSVPGASFFSLQKGDASTQMQSLPPHMKLVDLQRESADFADTAAAVTALDLIISVDTSIAHLAGALAKPVWILLTFVPDWRWLLHRDDSPWYPTARLFRQPTPGAWSEAIQAVRGALQQSIAHREL